MATEQWYAVKVSVPRTGQSQIEYVQASSTQQAGETFPGSTVIGGPYATEAAAEKAHPGGTSGTVTPPAGLPPATVSDKPVSPLSGLAAIGDFFGRLTEASLWIRVAEVILGLGLITVGLAHLAAGTPIGRAAAKAGKAAALL